MPKTTFEAQNGRKEMVLYYKDIRAINWFLATPLAADDENTDWARLSKTIPAHTRRKGPSDQSPTNIGTYQAEYINDPTLKSGNALPGRSIILQTTPNADLDATRQFTLVGRSQDFIDYFEDQMKYETYVYFSEGGRHTLFPDVGEG